MGSSAKACQGLDLMQRSYVVPSRGLGHNSIFTPEERKRGSRSCVGCASWNQIRRRAQKAVLCLAGRKNAELLESISLVHHVQWRESLQAADFVPLVPLIALKEGGIDVSLSWLLLYVGMPVSLPRRTAPCIQFPHLPSPFILATSSTTTSLEESCLTSGSTSYQLP